MAETIEDIYSTTNQRTYYVYFNHVRHENRLLLERLKGMLQLHSLLVIGYATMLNALVQVLRSPREVILQDFTWAIPLLQILVCFMGCYGSVTAWLSIRAAWKALNEYDDQFGKRFLVTPGLGHWPSLRGAGNSRLSKLGGTLVLWMPPVFLGGWILLLALPVAVLLGFVGS